MPVPVLVPFGGGQLCKIVLRGYLNRQIFLNTYWYESDPADVPTNYLTLLLNWYSTATAPYTAVLCNPAWLSDATMKIYSPAGAPVSPTLFMPQSQQFGTAGATPMPGQSCGLITRRVLRLTNANRGRVYVPFPATSAGSFDETPNAAYVSNLEDIASSLLPLTVPLNVVGQKWSPILFNPVTTGYQPLFAWEAQPKWATQKRRGDYGKLNN